MRDIMHRRGRGDRGRPFAVGLALAVLYWGCYGVPAWAHKVTIFAWVEGDTVHTQSKFSGGKPAKHSAVVVYDSEGNQLLEGKTDEDGSFSFKIPKRTGLMVALKASMGHLAEWTIPVEEVTGEAAGPEADVEQSKGGDGNVPDGPSLGRVDDTGRHHPSRAVSVGLSPEAIQLLIDESLDRKLAPVTKMLVDSLDRGPKVSDVVGGVGYIFGLFGVALYMANRNKGKKASADD